MSLSCARTVLKLCSHLSCSFLLFFALPSCSHSFSLSIRQEALVSNGKIRIIPYDSEAGQGECEEHYEELGKQLIEEFLERSHRTRGWQDTRSPKLPKGPGVGPQEKPRPPDIPCYPEEYDTIDRRRKKKLRYNNFEECGRTGLQNRDILRLSSVASASVRTRTEHTMHPDCAGNDKYRIGPVETEERLPGHPVLRPYKNGLLVKSGKLANSKQANCPSGSIRCRAGDGALPEQAHNCFVPLDVLEEFDSSASEERQNSPLSEEEEELEEIAVLSQAWCESSRRHGLTGDLAGHHARSALSLLHGEKPPPRTRGGKYGGGGIKQDATLSPVEEPTEEYVDAMDELQCLVETVSEYLAEKEEEISKIGTLQNSKTASSESGPFQQARPDGKQVEEGPHPEQGGGATLVSAAEDRGSRQGVSEALPDLTGVKNTVASLFSSLTEKVGSGTKHLTTSVERLVTSAPEKSEASAPSEGGTASAPPRKPQPEGASADGEAEGKAGTRSSDAPRSLAQGSSEEGAEAAHVEGKASVASAAPEPPAPPAQGPFSSQGAGSVVNSVLGIFNPLKIFSEKDALKRDTVRQEEPVKVDVSHASTLEVKAEEKRCEEKPKPASGPPDVSLSQKPLPQATSSSEATSTTGSGPVASLFGKLSSSVSSFSLKASLENLAVPRPPTEPPKKPPDAPQISNHPGEMDQEHPDASGNQPPAGKVLGGRQNHSQKEANAQPAAQGESADNFFSPLKKSFSQLLLPSSSSSSSEPVPKQTPLGFEKSHQSEEDVTKNSSASSSEPNFPFTAKLQIPFLSSFGFSESKPQDNAEKPGIFASILKAASVENLTASKDPTGQLVSSPKPPNAEMDPKNSTPEAVKRDSPRPFSVPAAPESKEKLLRRRDSGREEGWFAPESGNKHQAALDASRPGHRGHHPLRAQGHNNPKGGDQPVAAMQKAPELHMGLGTPTPAGGAGEGRTMDSTQRRGPQQGLLSGLFRRASSDRMVHKEEQSEKHEADSQTSGSSSLLSGLLRFASSENVSESQPEKAKSTSLGGIMRIFERNEEGPNSGDKNIGSQVDPSAQEGPGAKQEPSGFLRNLMPKGKGKAEERLAQISTTQGHPPKTEPKKTAQEQEGPFQRRHSTSPNALSLQEKAHVFSEKPLLYRRDTISNIYQSVITERPNEFLNSSLANAKMYGQSGQYLSLEEARYSPSFDWEYAAGEFPASAHQIPLPVYYVLSQNSVPLVEFLDWSESSETVINLCKKDGNANRVDWRSSTSFDMQSMDFSVMSYESLDQLGFQDAGLEENEPWDTHSSSGSLPPFDYSCTLEDAPMDLSYSSACDGNLWALIDEESLSTDGSYVYPSYSQEYQDWLMLLERGMWWPSEEGVCGYYMYSDGQYVYSLLTDPTGQYVYICTPDTDTDSRPACWDYSYPEDTWQTPALEDDMIAVCGFKVPLSNEDELFWFAEEQPLDNDFGNKPLDLSVALQRSDQLMNMNLETFSQMFEESIYCQREQPLDFSGYKLQKLKVDLRPEKEMERYPEEPPLMLDLRVHSRMASGRKLKDEAQSKQPDRTPASVVHDGGQSKWFGLHIFPSSVHSEPPGVSQSETEVKMAEEDKKAPMNKVTSLFSALGGLIAKSSDGHESLEDVAVKKAGGHSEWVEHKKDGLSPRPARKTGEEVQVRQPVSAGCKSDNQDAASPARLDSIRNGKPVHRPSARQNKAELARSPSHIALGAPENKADQLGNGHKTPATPGHHKPGVSLDEPKNTQAPPSHTTPESEGTIFKSALKIFSLGEDSPSTSAASDKNQAPGFFDFFRTQVNIAPQPPPAPQPNWMRKEVEQKPQGKAEASGISSFFGSIGDLFKVDAAPPAPSATAAPKSGGHSSPEIKERAHQGGREQSKTTAPSSSAPSWQAGVDAAQEPMVPTEEPQGGEPRKKAGELQRVPTGRPAPRAPRDEGHKPPLHMEHKPPMQTAPGVGTTNQPPAHHGPGPASLAGPPGGVQMGAMANKTQPGQGGQQAKELGFSLPFGFSQVAAPSKAQQAQPPASRSLFSFFSAPEKAPAPAPAAANAKPPENEGLFRIPSFLSGGAPAKKNVPQSTSSFSFFNLTSFLDEKPPAAPPQAGNLAQPQKTNSLAKPRPQQAGGKPSIKPGVSVDSDMGSARQPKTEKPEAATAMGVIEAVLGKKEEASESGASVVEAAAGSASARDASRPENSEKREAAAAAAPVGPEALGLPSTEAETSGQGAGPAAESVSEAKNEMEVPPVASRAPADGWRAEDQAVALGPGCGVPRVPRLQAESGHVPLVAPQPTEWLQEDTGQSAEGAFPTEEDVAPPDQNKASEDGEHQAVKEETAMDVAAAAEVDGHLHEPVAEVKSGVPEVRPPDAEPPSVAGVEPAPGWRPPPQVPAASHWPEKPKEAESDRSVLDSSVEMFSSFVTKMKPTKTLSGFFSPSQTSPAAPSPQKKSTSFFGLSSLPSGPSPAFTSDLFGGLFKGTAEEASSKPTGLSKPQDARPGAREAARPGLHKDPTGPDPKASGAEPSRLLKEPGEMLQGELPGGGGGGAGEALKEKGASLWPGGTSMEARPGRSETDARDGAEKGRELPLGASETRTSSQDQGSEAVQLEAHLLASDGPKNADLEIATDMEQAGMLEKTQVSVGPFGEDAVPAAEEERATPEQEAGAGTAEVSLGSAPGAPECKLDKAEKSPPESSLERVVEEPAVKNEADVDVHPSEAFESEVAADEAQELPHEERDSTPEAKTFSVEHEEPLTTKEDVPKEVPLKTSLDNRSRPASVPTEAAHPKPVFEIPSIPALPKFNFMSSTESSKPFGSFFSPQQPSGSKGAAEPGIMSSFNKFSSSLFGGASEERAGKAEAGGQGATFGKKLDFSLPWQKETKEAGAKKEPGAQPRSSSGPEKPPDASSEPGPRASEPSSKGSGTGESPEPASTNQPAEQVADSGFASGQPDSLAKEGHHGPASAVKVVTGQELVAVVPEEPGGELGGVSTEPPVSSLEGPSEETAAVQDPAEQKQNAPGPEAAAAFAHGLQPADDESSAEPAKRKRPVARTAS